MTRLPVYLTAATVAIVLAAGFAPFAYGTTDSELPYFDSIDLTPRWRPVDHRVAPFVLTTQTGESFDSRDLAGRVYVASFIYTRCSAICPRLVRSLQQVAAMTDPRVLLLSFSVTPELDPPSVLAEFGDARQIDPARWKLLTGERQVIYALAHSSLFADDGRLTGTGAQDEFLHTEKLVLVDGEGRLRGVYNGTQRADVEHLIDDAQRLVRSN